MEEIRLEALKTWTQQQQVREEQRLAAEAELESYILSKAKAEAAFWEKAVTVLDIQRQIAEAELVKAQDRRLDELLIRKATADAERSEHETQITAIELTRKATFEADRAEAEVSLVKCQKRKVEIEKEKLQLEKDFVLAETAKAVAEGQLAASQAAAATAATQAALSAPPSQVEVKQLMAKLEQMDPCSGGYQWVDTPSEGGFRCEGGSHFKSYAEARSMVSK